MSHLLHQEHSLEEIKQTIRQMMAKFVLESFEVNNDRLVGLGVVGTEDERPGDVRLGHFGVLGTNPDGDLDLDF